MADEETTEVEEPKKKKGMMGMIIWVVISLAMCGVGFAIPIMFPSLVGDVEEAEEELDVAELTEPAFVPFGDIVVNLNSDMLNRYLRISITLQVDESDEEEMTELVEKKKAILKSWLISYLSEVRKEDIRGSLGQNRIRRHIQDHFNSVMFDDGYDRIHDVLFEEFNVQ